MPAQLTGGIGRRWSSEIETSGVRKVAIDGPQIREIQAPVQRRDRLADEVLQEGIVEQVDMEVEDVESDASARTSSSITM